MSAYWLGMLTLPLGAGLIYLLVLIFHALRTLAGKAFGGLLRRYPPVVDGQDAGLDFPMMTSTSFGHRSAFAAIALASRSLYLFEPISGLGIFIMVGRPKQHTEQTRRAKQAIERAYENLLEEETKS